MTDCLAIPGQVEADSLPSQSLAETLEFLIYLPPCYNEHGSQHYPVLYLLHGQTYTNDQWVRLGAPAIADRLIAAGDAPPFIIVMPYDPSWKQPTEYGFAEALTEELIPYVDAHYRTIPSRGQRAIGGLSRGAGWAIHLGLTRPDLFAAFGAHSPVVFWTDGPHLGEWLKAIPPDLLPRIYLDIGDNDHELQTALELEDILNQQNIPHEWHLYPGYHEEAYWHAHVEEYLRWYVTGWR
jgi:enterochelin esterase-like enzyme